MIKKTKFYKALQNAFSGILYFFKNEKNGKIEVTIAFLTIMIAFYLRINNTEWMIIVVNIGVVIAFEMINTAIEQLSNVVHLQTHSTIKIVKDVAAGAVLSVAIVSVAIACFIFLPKL